MFLLDNEDRLVDSEFSLDVIDGVPCVVIESSGGANPARQITRRNPEYNRLVEFLLARIGKANARLTAVILDSSRVASLSVSDRTATFDTPYPIDLSLVDPNQFRRTLGRAVAAMHRSPDAKSGGNAQKRIRLCVDRVLSPDQLLSETGRTERARHTSAEHRPGLNETEKSYLTKARLGQGIFRKELLKTFNSTCPLLGITNKDLLVASHVKPWTACTNHERLDPNNGILLSSLLDRLFDQGLITFEADGAVQPSTLLSTDDQIRCQLNQLPKLQLQTETVKYLSYHQKCVFREIIH